MMNKPSDQELDASVAMLLRIGVTLAAALALLGGALSGRRLLDKLPDYSHFQPGNPGLSSISGVIAGAMHLTPGSIIQLGLLILIATPIARVVLCLVGFTRQGNKLYTAVSMIVFAILIFSFIRTGR